MTRRIIIIILILGIFWFILGEIRVLWLSRVLTQFGK